MPRKIQNMKICLLGNMNNNNYVLAKLLRRRGVDAHLILYDHEYSFFLPEHEDASLKDNYPGWIKKVSWGTSTKSFYMTKGRDIQADLGSFDLYVVCGRGPAFLRKARIKNFIFLPYGSDLYRVPFWRRQMEGYWRDFFKNISIIHLRILEFLPAFYLCSIQQKGIRESLAISLVLQRPLDEPIEKLNLKRKSVPLGFAIDMEKFSQNKVRKEISNARDQNLKRLMSKQKEFDFTVFSPARQAWVKSLADPRDITDGNKRNDILIEGIDKLIKKQRLSPLLVLVEKGVDVLASKELIKKLEMEKNVLWIQETPRENLRFYYYVSDIVADQFQAGGYGTTVLEALSLENPVLTYISDDFESITGRPPPPHLNARNSDDIFYALKDFVADKDKYIDISKKGKQWVAKYHGDGLVDEYIKFFEHLLSGRNSTEFTPSFNFRET